MNTTRFSKRAGLTGAALLLLTPACCTPAAPRAAHARAVEGLLSAYDQPATPGCAVGAFENGAPQFVRGFGAANIRTGEKIDGDTVFYAASLAKQFTAIGITKLIEQGKVSLSDDVRRFIPELPRYESPITVAMLMHHTSGLRDFLTAFYLAGVHDFDRITAPLALEMIVRQRRTNFRPGTRFSYSNSGYELLAEIIRRVTSQPFDEYIHKTVFAPLGMTKSSMRPRPTPAGARVALGYLVTPDGYSPRENYPHVAGAGGLMTTLNDLAKFDRDFYVDHRVWTDETRRLMLEPDTLANGEKVIVPGEQLYYAGGLMVGERAGQRWITHSGGSPSGFNGVYTRLPDLKFSIALLCNRSDAKPVDKADKLIEALRASDLHGAKIVSDPIPWDRPPPTQPLSAELRDALVGEYAAEEIGARYVFRRVDGELNVSVASLYDPRLRTGVLAKITERSKQTVYAGTMKLALTRAADGSISGFELTADRAAGVVFVRVAEPVTGQPGTVRRPRS